MSSDDSEIVNEHAPSHSRKGSCRGKSFTSWTRNRETGVALTAKAQPSICRTVLDEDRGVDEPRHLGKLGYVC